MTDQIEGLNAQAVQFSQRAQQIMDNAPWADHQTVAALAQTPGNPVDQTKSLGATLASTWDGYEHTFADPVLQQGPSQQLAVSQYFHSTIGAPPIEAGSLTSVQQSLQANGVGAGLDPTGVWDSQWQQAWNQALNDQKAEQLAGNKPGSVKSSSFLHTVLHTFTPSGIGDALIGWAKSAKDIGADALANIVNLPQVVEDATKGNITPAIGVAANLTTFGALGGNKDLGKQAARVGASIQSLGEDHVTAEQFEAKQNLLRQLGDALTIASFVGGGSLAKKTVAQVGEDFAKGILPKTAEEVTRSPGVIAKTLFNATGDGKLIGSKWVGNLPGLARLTPTIGKLASGDGFYYTARTFAASPYRLPAVRAAGTVFGKAQLGSAAVTGLAEATPGTQQSQDVLGTHVLDQVNTNIDNWEKRNIGWSPVNLDTAQLFLHGPLSGAGRTSETAGALARSVQNGFVDALGTKGVAAAFQQGLATGRSALSHKDMLGIAGGDLALLNSWMTNKTIGYARDFYIERALGHPVSLANADEETQVAQLSDQFYKTPGLARNTVAQMLDGDSNVQNLTNRIKADLLRNVASPKAAMRESLQDYGTAMTHVQGMNRAGDFEHFVTPQGQAVKAAQMAEQSVAKLPTDTEPSTALEPGSFGIARNDTVTSGEANRAADEFETALAEAPDADSSLAVVTDMMDYLHTNFNMDARRLGVAGSTPAKLVQMIRTRADSLAGDVHLSFDAPVATQERVQALKGMGYKLVVGSHIGHVFDGSQPDIGELGGWTSATRKWAGKAGLEPGNIRDTDVGRAAHLSILNSLTDAVRNDARIHLPAWATPQTIMGLLVQDKAIEGLGLPWYSRMALGAAKRVGLNKSAVDLLAKANGGDRTAAEAKLEADLAFGQSTRDLSRTKIVKTLMTPKTVTTPTGSQWDWGGMDETSANLIYRALMNGYRQPTYMMGMGAIEDWARAGTGFGDKIARALPNSSLTQRVVNWPNRVVQVRNDLRFTMSPLFDARRLVKQNLKMGLEGVPPVKNPIKVLMDAGQEDQANNLLAKISGKGSALDEQQIDADRTLVGHSVFGLYNPTWHAAYFVNELKNQGKTDDEIKAAYNRAFKYGTGGGRSAAERTANTIFFPFSFEKTVIRNGLGYLIDHPAQALILDSAVDAWRKADKNAAVGNWVYDHAPILNEMNKLNAFSHGISPGQLGGINAPIIDPIIGAGGKVMTSGDKSAALLNLFLPQQWGANLTEANVEKYLPVFSQFAGVWKDATATAQVGYNAAYDTVNKTLGNKDFQPRSALTAGGQIGAALQAKAGMVTELQSVVDFNDKQSDPADKMNWPQTSEVPHILGQPIDKTTIGTYVSSIYPAYSPAGAAASAESKAAQSAQFIDKVSQTDPVKADEMTSFAKAANTIIGKINRDSYTPADQATIQEAARGIAKTVGETDPDWVKFYTTYFQSSLGPIEDIYGKGTKA